MNEPIQPNPAAHYESGTEKPGIDVVGCLLRHKWLIVFLGIVGSGLGYLYFLREPALFQSTARILVIGDDNSDLPLREGSQRRSYESNTNVVTQSLLLRSPAVVSEAVKTHHLDNLSMFAGYRDPTGKIIEGLTVKQTEITTNVLDLIYQGGDPKDCQTVVSAIIESYETFLDETHQSVSARTAELITEANEKLLKELDRKERDYREFRQNASLIFTKEGNVNVHQIRLSQIESTRSGLLISRSQTKAQLQSLESAIQRGGSREAIMLMMDKYAANPSADANRSGIAAELFPLLLEEQMLLEDHGPDHPKVRTIQKKIDITRSHLQAKRAEERDEDGGKRNNSPTDFIGVYLESLKEDINACDEKINELDELFKTEKDAAKNLAEDEALDESHRHGLARTSQLFDAVVKRLEEINVLQDHAKLRTRRLQDASLGRQIAPSMTRIVGSGTALGLFMGMVISVLLEMSDKRFRSPEEIADSLNLPVIGHIPFYMPASINSTESPLDASLCVFHRPKSSLAEAHRGIRTALYFSTRGEGHKVIQMTSPNPGDGKSTLAANLAVTIAQSGKKILLMDCDFRRPRVHRLLGISNKLGVTSVISGDTELIDAIQETAEPGLYAMPCGPRPANPSELLSSPRFAELLAILREKFDYVIVDTPPVMAVTDPAVVAPRVDGVMMAIRINKRSRQDCVRSTELLSSLGVTLLGVIVNGNNEKDGYGYGHGGYGNYNRSGRYGGGYGRYGYVAGYGYSDGGRYGTYYQDDADEQRTQRGAKIVKTNAKSTLPPEIA